MNKRKETDEAEGWSNYMSMKLSKLRNQFNGEIKKKEGIFSGVAIFVNGYTDPCAEKLKEIMLENCGIYHHYYCHGKTTHIIASNLADTKIKNVKNKLIVNPKWVVDSLSASKLLDYSNYLIYTNRMPNQPSIISMYDASDGSSAAVNVSKINKRFKSDSATVSKSENIFDSQDLDAKPVPVSCDIKSNLLTSKGTNEKKEQILIDKTPEAATSSRNYNSRISDTYRKPVNTSNQNFLSEFYANSRLHHISSMATLFKDYVEKCHAEGKTLCEREKFKHWLENQGDNNSNSQTENQPVIMHLDMDCFFVSVGLRNRPDLRGKPVVVTHSKGTGPVVQNGSDRAAEIRIYADKNLKLTTNVSKNGSTTSSKVPSDNFKTKFYGIDEHCSMAEIACCSYEARAFGIKNGMLLGPALKLCPSLKTIQYDFDTYKEISFKMYDLITSFTNRVEAVSCDEMYIDVTTDINQLGSSPMLLAEFFRKAIVSSTCCSCSIGIGPNMLLARLATKKAKPNGVCWVSQSETVDFIKECSLADVPGIGWSLRTKLEANGVLSCGELQTWELTQIQNIIGRKMGQSLFNYCRGIDDRVVTCQSKRKSVSAEINYGIRFQNWTDADEFIIKLSSEVADRLKSCDMKGKTITLKVKIRSPSAPVEAAKFMGHGACDNASKSVSMPTAVSQAKVIKEKTMELLKSICTNPQDLRGIGIQISKLMKGEICEKNSLKNYFSTDSCRNIAINQTKMENPIVIKDKMIDINMLNELPEHLRREVSAEYKFNGYLISNDVIPPQNLRKNQFSPEVQEVVEARDGETNTISSDCIKEDINYSQINTNFLEALPDSIKEELKEQLSSVDKFSPVAKLAKRRRGRPRGKSVKSVCVLPFRTESIPSTSKCPAETKDHRVSLIKATANKPADLGGETEFNAIKQLLVKWIMSSGAPEDEDLNEIISYCKHLIVGRDLETLDIFLKFFRRKLFGHSKDWELALQRITNRVQAYMMEIYNCPLKLPRSCSSTAVI